MKEIFDQNIQSHPCNNTKNVLRNFRMFQTKSTSVIISQTDYCKLSLKRIRPVEKPVYTAGTPFAGLMRKYLKSFLVCCKWVGTERIKTGKIFWTPLRMLEYSNTNLRSTSKDERALSPTLWFICSREISPLCRYLDAQIAMACTLVWKIEGRIMDFYAWSRKYITLVHFH